MNLNYLTGYFRLALTMTSFKSNFKAFSISFSALLEEVTGDKLNK